LSGNTGGHAVKHANDPDALFDQLQMLGAGEFAHFDGSLADHLRGTECLLRARGSADAVCAAGLYHAAYGTDGYAPALASIDQRRDIAALIGAEAEALAYLYGACDRDLFHPRIGTPLQLVFRDRFSGTEYGIRREQLAQFCELTVANELEITGRNADYRAKHRASLSELFERMSGLASPAAFDAGKAMLG
jgi:hypothetical protein